MNVAEEFYLVESIKLAMGAADADRRIHEQASEGVEPNSDYYKARSDDMTFSRGRIHGLQEALKLVENLSKVVGQ